jgi:hypothetical protein
MDRKIVKARLANNKRVDGYGVKFIGNEIYIITASGEYPIMPGSLRIIGDNDTEQTIETQIPQEKVTELHNLLVNTAVKFLKDNNLIQIDELSLGADGLMTSVGFGEWTPATDSSLSLYGIENGKFVRIGYSI